MDKENELRDKIDNLQETINVYSVLETNKDKEIARLKEEVAQVISNIEKPTGAKKNKGSKAAESVKENLPLENLIEK